MKRKKRWVEAVGGLTYQGLGFENLRRSLTAGFHSPGLSPLLLNDNLNCTVPYLSVRNFFFKYPLLSRTPLRENKPRSFLFFASLAYSASVIRFHVFHA